MGVKLFGELGSFVERKGKGLRVLEKRKDSPC